MNKEATEIIKVALEGFYKAYLQMYLPSTVANTLHYETKKMVRALHHYCPDECRFIIYDIIYRHGTGKGDNYIAAHVQEANGWILEAIEDDKIMHSQLTETIQKELNEYYQQPCDSMGDQQV